MNNINLVMTEIINWFQSNLLTMNCNKHTSCNSWLKLKMK